MIPPPVGLAEEQVDEHIMGIILALYLSLKKGIELFGDRSEEATTKELQAIHDMVTYKPQDASKLSKKETCDAM